MIAESIPEETPQEEFQESDNRLTILRRRLDSQSNPHVRVAGSVVHREEAFWKPERIDIFIAPTTPQWRPAQLNGFSWNIMEGLYGIYFLPAHVTKDTLYLPYAGFTRQKGKETTYTDLCTQDEEFLSAIGIPYEEENQMRKRPISQLIDLHFYPELSFAQRAKE